MLEDPPAVRARLALSLLVIAVGAPALPAAAPSARDMVRLPGGTYTMGDKGKVTIAPFLIDRTAVTVATYEACVNAGKCSAAGTVGNCNSEKADRADHPVNCVDFSQATAFCAFAAKRLPTEEEREWAARAADRGTTYPWGNDEPRGRLCWDGENRGGRDGTCPVGAYPKGDSPQGVKDLAGNVEEWTSSMYSSTVPGARVVRGGSWYGEEPRFFAAANRNAALPSRPSPVLGFRCVKDP